MFDNILTQVTKKTPKSLKKTWHFIGGSLKTRILPGVKNKNVYQTEKASDLSF
jgi:hypothetical protein